MESSPASYGSSTVTTGSSPGSASHCFKLRRDTILREIQQMVNRYNECFLCLQDALADVEHLRRDNIKLAADNLDLSFLLDDLEAAQRPDPLVAPPPPRTIPTAPLPKSISIRSPGFLAVKSGSGEGEADRRPHRLRLQGGGGEKEEEEAAETAVEVEVYEQGTAKTELCNKWGETGRCSYGERCRFAHGIQELRPVIRHPRYKTQLCRMLDGCPYGHRCHFRHAALP